MPNPSSAIGAGSKPTPPRRKPLRLREYNYAQAGMYFVTICVKNRTCLFGEITDSTMCLSASGAQLLAVWHELPEHYPNVELGQFVIMPNHFHGILALEADPIAKNRSSQVEGGVNTAPNRQPLSEIVRALKTYSARRINVAMGTSGVALWQRNYYEHVIRNELDYDRIVEYIVNNPAQWELDSLNPACRDVLMADKSGRV